MRYQFLASALAAQVALAAAMPDHTVYETEVDTITSCGPEVTNCPARSTATQPPAVATTESAPVASTTAPVSGEGQTCEQQENMCRSGKDANMAQCSADRAACDGYIPGQPSGSGPAPSGPAASGSGSGSAPAPSAPATTAAPSVPVGDDGKPKTVFQTQEITITSCGADVTNCPARSTGTGAVPKPSTTAPVSGESQTCEQQENMCRSGKDANMAQCSADRAACDGYIPGQPSGTVPAAGTGSGPKPSSPAGAGTPECEKKESMCRSAPGANMAQCSAERASCDGYIPGQPGTPGSNATASLSTPTPTPAQPTPAQWTGAASTSFVSFGVMALGAAAAAFVL